MKTIPLTRGLFAKVDDADFDWLSKAKWYAQRTAPGVFYAARGHGILMHREILPGAVEVDHVNQDKLDNRRENLRTADSHRNKANIRRRKDSVSGFKGVSWDPNLKAWRADITSFGRHRYLGKFKVALDAAVVYDEAARKEFGEFACVNFQ
jgi:hypothetical protein